MYVQAADDKFCRKIKGIGSSVDCWSSVLLNKITTVTCSGDHYSMMDSRRGPDVGKVVTVAALLKFRSLFPNRYRIVVNGCHKQSLMTLKQSGLKVVFIKKTGNCCNYLTSYISIVSLKLLNDNAKGGSNLPPCMECLCCKTGEWFLVC